MKISWASQIETWNDLIKRGEGNQVGRELRRIPRDEIPIEQLAKIANISWRINQSSIGLRLLFPRLRTQGNLKIVNALDAFTEYAGCLLEVGALSEARQVLRDLRGRTPRSKFYSALLMFKEWDYLSAVPLLEDYLREIPADYHQLVVRVNLASTYVNIHDRSRAIPFLRALQTELEAKGHWLLLGNSYEIESQIYFERREHHQALECLTKSEKYLGQARNMGWIYCKKWQFINRLYQTRTAALEVARTTSVGGAPHALYSEWATLRTDALSMGSWETLRELDLHWAICTENQELLNHVYYGSPIKSYREKIHALIKREAPNLEILASFDWLRVRQTGVKSRLANFRDLIMDFKSSVQGNNQSILLKRLLYILCSDFYAPFRIGQLFSILFEGEFYDLETSPDRVFQLIKRLRAWISEREIGCEIIWGRRGYAIQFSKNHGIVLERDIAEQGLPNKTNIHYLFLHDRFGGDPFSSSAVGDQMNCSTRTANRVLNELISEGRVVSMGRGRFTRFKIVA
jgi:hypothetical protein